MVVPKTQQVNCDTLKTTLAIIKPDGMQYEKRILQKLIGNGFHIIQRKKFQLSPELAADFYKDYEKCKCYMILVLNLSNGPIEAIILTKVNAVYDLLDLVGPEKPSEARCCNPQTLRSIFGDCEDDYKNAIHASIDPKSARREINFFFPNFVVEPISIEMSKKICCVRRDIIEKLIEGLFDITKTKPEELKTWLANWFIENNPNRPMIYTDYTSVTVPMPMPVKMNNICIYDNMPLQGDSICQHASPEYDRFKPCTTDQRDNIDLEKILCCCNDGIQPNEIVNCPICDKMIVYTAPFDQGAIKKIKSPSESTATSLSSSSSVLSSCKCVVEDPNRKSTSSSMSCKCDKKEEIGGGSVLTSSSTSSLDRCDCKHSKLKK